MDNRQITAPQGNPTQVLVFGIIGLALCETGVFGLIFSIIALSKAKNYVNTYGPVSTQANIGRRLAIAGLIVSIIFIVFWIVFIICMITLGVHLAQDPDTSSKLKELSNFLKNYN